MLDTRMTKEERIINNDRMREALRELNKEGHTLKYFSRIVGYSYGGFRNFMSGRSNMHPSNLYVLQKHLKERFDVNVKFTNDDRRKAIEI